MPDSVVDAAAAFSIIFPVRTVYFAPAGALEVSGRMLPGESRNSTSQERVGCGPPRDPPPTLACRALPRAENDRVFLRAARASAFGSQNGAGSRRFFPKKVYYGGSPGSNPGKLKKILILVPTRVLFLARFRFERRNPRLERRTFTLYVPGAGS